MTGNNYASLARMIWEGPEDYSAMHRGRDRIEVAFDSLTELFREGKPFREVREEIAELLKPCQDYHIDLIPEDEPFHSSPGERQVAKGELITLDCSLKLDNLWTDRTVTVACGEVDDKRRLLLETARKAFMTVRDYSIPGAPFRYVIEKLNDFLKEGPCGLVPDCGGHGIGYELHQGEDYIYSNSESDQIIPVGSAFTVEPVIFLNEGKRKLYAYFEDTIIPD